MKYKNHIPNLKIIFFFKKTTKFREQNIRKNINDEVSKFHRR